MEGLAPLPSDRNGIGFIVGGGGRGDKPSTPGAKDYRRPPMSQISVLRTLGQTGSFPQVDTVPKYAVDVARVDLLEPVNKL